MSAIRSYLHLAIRNLFRNTDRTLVGVSAVAAGIIAYLLAGGFIAWIFQDMREATIHSQLGHVQIVRPGFFDKGIADPYAFLLPSGDADRKTVEAARSVTFVTPRLVVNGLVSRGDVTLAFAGEGVDPVREKEISSRISIMAGKDLGGANQKGALLGEGLAKSLGAGPGDSIVLLVKTASGSSNAVELTVAGTFATVAKEYDDHAIRLPIETARRLMRVAGATSWVVVLNRTEDTGAAVVELRQRLPAKDFEVVPWTDLADFYNKTVTLFSKQVRVVQIIIGLIIVLTISNTMTMSVLERTTEIGTSLAVGLPSRVVTLLFVVESLLIGVLGAVTGLTLGYLAAKGISTIGIPMPPPPGMAHGYLGKIVITPDLAWNGAMLALVTSLLAAVMPAWKAGRMNIVDALRYNQ